MITARQCRGVSWLISGMVILCGWCGPLAAAPYSGGEGTFQTPYQLSTAADLTALVNTPADWASWFVLTADVDMQSAPFAKPIGSRQFPFTGVFDGAGHCIKGLVVSEPAAVNISLGMFGTVRPPAVIERVRLIAPMVKTAGTAAVGALVGETFKGATIQQCSVEQGTVSAPACTAAGGLIGDNAGTVRECFSSTASTAFGLAGGLLGRNTGTVENCVAAAAATTLKVGAGTAAGGFSGADVGGSLQFCLARSPSVTGMRAGGLVGYSDPNSVLQNCICNRVVAKAVENWPADVVGSAWCEDPENLSDPGLFNGLGWDLKAIWFMDRSGALRLRWMNGSPAAVAKGPSGIVRPDPATGLATVVLDGTKSVDLDRDVLSYTWKCRAANGQLMDVAIDPVPSPSVRLRAGTYKIELTVNDGMADSPPSAVSVTINTPPTAQAGTPQDVSDEGAGVRKVRLDASQSSDPEAGKGQALAYSWTCATATPSKASGPAPALEFPVGTHTVSLVVSDGVESDQATTQVIVRSAVPAARSAVSPRTIGRTSVVPDVKFYLLLPGERNVSNVDPRAPMDLDWNGTKVPLKVDPAHGHKTQTVVVFADRKKILDMVGAMNGPMPVKVNVRLNTGEIVSTAVNLEIVAGPGPSPNQVQAERTYYYLDTTTWK